MRSAGGAGSAGYRSTRRKEGATVKAPTQEAPHGQSSSSGDEHLRQEELIAKRAYELWLAGGCCHGNDVSDWLHAEQEVREQRATATASALGGDEEPITPNA